MTTTFTPKVPSADDDECVDVAEVVTELAARLVEKMVVSQVPVMVASGIA